MSISGVSGTGRGRGRGSRGGRGFRGGRGGRSSASVSEGERGSGEGKEGGKDGGKEVVKEVVPKDDTGRTPIFLKDIVGGRRGRGGRGGGRGRTSSLVRALIADSTDSTSYLTKKMDISSSDIADRIIQKKGKIKTFFLFFILFCFILFCIVLFCFVLILIQFKLLSNFFP